MKDNKHDGLYLACSWDYPFLKEQKFPPGMLSDNPSRSGRDVMMSADEHSCYTLVQPASKLSIRREEPREDWAPAPILSPLLRPLLAPQIHVSRVSPIGELACGLTLVKVIITISPSSFGNVDVPFIGIGRPSKRTEGEKNEASK